MVSIPGGLSPSMVWLFEHRAGDRGHWGLALASVAGARRTESSFPTYVASTNPSTIGILTTYDDPELGIKNGYNPEIVKTISHLPQVLRSTTSLIFDGNIDINAIKGLHPTSSPASPPDVPRQLER